jgi:hypothetical protein
MGRSFFYIRILMNYEDIPETTNFLQAIFFLEVLPQKFSL